MVFLAFKGRVVKLDDGDVLVFDASRAAHVEHGVDAIYGGGGDRVSVQWRVCRPERDAKMKLAWIAKNLADFPDELFASCLAALGRAPGSGASGRRLADVQTLISLANSDQSRARTLFDVVQDVCQAHPKQFLAKRLVGAGQGRCVFESAWHVDTTITASDDVWIHDRVSVPSRPGAPGTCWRPGPSGSTAFIRLT